MKMKKWVWYVAAGVVLLLALWGAWTRWASPTRIALVNFQNFQVAKMARSADRNISVDQLTIDDFDRLKRYDAVLIFGMGIRMTDQHRALLGYLGDKGMPVYTTAATDPMNDISTLDSLQGRIVGDYLSNGCTANYRSLFNYIRRDLDRKTLFTGAVEPVVELSGDVLFHTDGDRSFPTVAEFEKYYMENGFYKKGAPKVALVAGFAGPFDTNKEHLDAIINALEAEGLNVYPISSIMRRLELLQEIGPDAVVYMPHGRLLMGQGERGVEWLRERDIPIFCPITLNATYEDWSRDKQGMIGGFMSQSVVMPELDGGIVPMAVTAQFIDKDGLYLFDEIPGRAQQFASTVSNYIALGDKPNGEKRVAVYYFKGPGSGSLTAAGLEVVPSLYNLLEKMKQEGYDVRNLPATEKEFEKMIMERGPVFNSYAEGNISRYLESGYPRYVSVSEYDGWLRETLLPEEYDALVERYGTPPGEYLAMERNGEPGIAVTAVDFGNVVLLPQPIQGVGENSFEAVHGSNPVPPHHYLASYLWARNGFGADAMIHFGTHGSLEFIPGKQVALSQADWADRLVRDVPHIYLYTIADVGEGIIAKRRSYATLVSHLNPPFMDTDLRGEIKELSDAIRAYLATEERSETQNLKIKRMAVDMGLHRDLQLDTLPGIPYTDEDIVRIDNFAEELCTEKITSGLYTLGEPFDEERIASSVVMMSTDPIAYSLASLDRLRGRVTKDQIENNRYFGEHYRTPAERVVRRILSEPGTDADAQLRSLGVSADDLAKARDIRQRMEPKTNRMMSMMMDMAKKSEESGKKVKIGSGHPSWIPKTGKMPDFVKERIEKNEQADGKKTADMPSKEDGDAQEAMAAMMAAMNEQPSVSPEEKEFANAVLAIETAVRNVNGYREALRDSPTAELDAMMNALDGGYIAPSPGGDFIANPNTVPTGRNLYSINAEATPSVAAWEKGVMLAKSLIADYQKNNGGNLPRKVSFTLWSGSFIESEGTTVAQILYLLGAEPVRDQFGRVLDVRLIPVEELGRPRIDVVVQTSGQFRDLAASRLTLLQKAIDMAASAQDGGENYVAEGKNSAEKVLLEKGFTPKEARELATTRIFGGLNGMAGTGITAMVEAGDRWEDESEIARTYLHNMGAVYGDQKSWGDFREGVFEAALQNTDAVVQPRQSNTWGALSLDHVYEFMGGVTLAVRNVTGKDPDNYFNDLRNRYNVRVQDLQSAIGVESRTTLFNPAYIKEQMKGGASSASSFTEIVRNTYGWNVMKPSAIDDSMWDRIYDVYVEDDLGLGTQRFFEAESPAALQEMTAIMLETARKGYWEASPEQLERLAEVHSEMVEKYDACCNGFTCDNAKLRDFIARQLPEQQAKAYSRKIDHAREAVVSDGKGVVLEKDETAAAEQDKTFGRRTALIAFGVICIVGLMIFFVKRRRNG